MKPAKPPMPPLSLRQRVGQSHEQYYDNPTRKPVWQLPSRLKESINYYYSTVYDFGCGPGRQARQLLLQDPIPERYLGVDIDEEAIRWCQKNLSAFEPRFEFEHMNLFHSTYSPRGQKGDTRPLPGDSGKFTLFNAHSVFTHLYWHQAIYYLEEAYRLVADDGILRTTWLFFDKRMFPQLNANQHNIFLQLEDPTQAVFYDLDDTIQMWDEIGMTVLSIDWPKTYGRPSVVFLGKGSYFGHSTKLTSPPRTVPGSDLDDSLVGTHDSGWRQRNADKLSERLREFGISDFEVNPADATVKIDQQAVKRAEIELRAVCRQHGFALVKK